MSFIPSEYKLQVLLLSLSSYKRSSDNGFWFYMDLVLLRLGLVYERLNGLKIPLLPVMESTYARQLQFRMKTLPDVAVGQINFWFSVVNPMGELSPRTTTKHHSSAVESTSNVEPPYFRGFTHVWTTIWGKRFCHNKVLRVMIRASDWKLCRGTKHYPWPNGSVFQKITRFLNPEKVVFQNQISKKAGIELYRDGSEPVILPKLLKS